MKNIVFIIYLILLNICAINAQNKHIVLSGIISEQNSEHIVPYANIGVRGFAIGTVSNGQGKFEFHIPKKYVNDSLVISCIGYYDYSIAIKDIKNTQSFNISLRPRAYFLGEVTIKPKHTVSALEILQHAFKRIPTNYLNKAYLMDGFYREYFEENDTFVAFAESAVSIYDDEAYDYKETKTKEAIAINEIRVSDIYNKGDYVLYIDINYALRSNILRNATYWEKYLKKSKYDIIHLGIDSMTYYGNDMVYCISYEIDSKKKSNYRGKFYVRQNDYAILRIEINTANPSKNQEINGSPYESRAVLTYKQHEGKMYLNYINASHKTSYTLYKEEVAEQYDLTFYSELLINNITSENVKPIALNAKVKEESIFYQPRYRTYNPEYWESYTLFEESAENANIINNLEKQRSLEEQYRANGKLKTTEQRGLDKNTDKASNNYKSRSGPY